MKNVSISEEVATAVPGLRVWVVECDIVNGPTSDALWQEIESEANSLRESLELGMVNSRPGIRATRAAYKALGKEPNRYRPSAEALTRRCVKGMELYRTSAVVDLTNLLSLRSGHSIGAFDRDAIAGDSLTLGVGREGEPYEAIGRGMLNIAHLPVFRDAIGGVGTPTSDNERTKLSDSTVHLIMTINIYGEGCIDGRATAEMAIDLLRRYASASSVEMKEISAVQTQD